MSRVQDLLAQLGVEVDAQLFRLALTHSSFAYENGRLPDNERLEFLGDAVLELVVTDHIYRSFPEDSEGRLAKLRAAVVNANALASIARDLEIGQELLLGKGEEITGGAHKNSLLANAVEAIIGAVFLSAGQDAASLFVHHLLDPVIADAVAKGAGSDWKTTLQELAAQNELGSPEYIVDETGPDHNKSFSSVVQLNDFVSRVGYGTSKKQAEQGAAQAAVEQLRERFAASAEVSKAEFQHISTAANTPTQD